MIKLKNNGSSRDAHRKAGNGARKHSRPKGIPEHRSKVIRAEIKYRAYDRQRLIHQDQTRFRVCCAGRRSGKTMAGVVEATMKALAEPDQNILWLAPFYPATQRGWDMMLRLVSRNILQPHKAERYIGFPNGSRVYFGSGDSPSSVLGHGFHLAIIDEAARVPDEAWQTIIRPTLSDHQGGLLAISSPLFKAGWFYRMMLAGQDRAVKDVSYHHFPSSANPWLEPEEIEAARRELPADVFEREYLAVPQAAGGDVFKGLQKATVDYTFPGHHQEGHIYVMGVDLARKADFTVITVIDATMLSLGGKARLVQMHRFNAMPWEDQIDRITKIAQAWEANPVVVDATGLGDVVSESLSYVHGLPVEPIVFTAPSKAGMVSKLKVGIESQALELPLPDKSPEAQQLHLELSAFTMKLTGVTGVKYEAPEGMHDDAVASLMLAFSHADTAGVPLVAMAI